MTPGSPGRVGALAPSTAAWFLLVLLRGSVGASAEQHLATVPSESPPERGRRGTALFRTSSLSVGVPSRSLKNAKAVGAYKEASGGVPSDLLSETTRFNGYPAGVGDESQGDKSMQGSQRRSTMHPLVHWRKSSPRGLSRPSGTVLKRSVAAILTVTAVVGTLLQGGRVLEGRHGDAKHRHSPVTSAVGLRSVSSIGNFFVTLVVLTVLSAAFAAPTTRAAQATHKKPPPVEKSTDENGTTLVRIGRGWTDDKGHNQGGHRPVVIAWNGIKYELYLSKHTEDALRGRDKLRVLHFLLHLPPRLKEGQDSGSVWVWGSTTRGRSPEPFHTWTSSSNGLKCEVAVFPEIEAALQDGEARHDFLQVVDAFLDNAVFPLPAKSTENPQRGRVLLGASAREGIPTPVVPRPQLASTGELLRPEVPGYPSVREGTLVGGEKVVVIGRDWNTRDRKRIQGHNPIKVTSGGKTFVLFLSSRTEWFLEKQGLLSGLRSVLSRDPQRVEVDKEVAWERGASTPPSGSVYFEGSPGVAKGTHYQILLPSGARDWLALNEPEPGASEARNDLRVVLETFLQELASPSDAPARAGEMDGRQSSVGVYLSTPALETDFRVPHSNPTTEVGTTYPETITPVSPVPSLETTEAPVTSQERPSAAPSGTPLEPTTTEAPTTTYMEISTTGGLPTASLEASPSGAPTTTLETSTTGALATNSMETSTSTTGASTATVETSPTAAPRIARETATEPPTVPVQAATSQQPTFLATTEELNLDEEVEELDLESLNLGNSETQELSSLYNWSSLPPLDLYTKADGTRTWVVGREWKDDNGYGEVKAGKTAVRFKLDGKTDFIVLLSEGVEQALKKDGALNRLVNVLKSPPSMPELVKGPEGDEQEVHWGSRTDPLGSGTYLSEGINYYFHVPQEVYAIFEKDRVAASDWSSLMQVTVKGIQEERKKN